MWHSSIAFKQHWWKVSQVIKRFHTFYKNKPVLISYVKAIPNYMNSLPSSIHNICFECAGSFVVWRFLFTSNRSCIQRHQIKVLFQHNFPLFPWCVLMIAVEFLPLKIDSFLHLKWSILWSVFCPHQPRFFVLNVDISWMKMPKNVRHVCPPCCFL